MCHDFPFELALGEPVAYLNLHWQEREHSSVMGRRLS
jgi:hypothetical protein